MTDDQALRIDVDSQPSDTELAAITAAVMAMRSSSPEPHVKPAPNPWREANKRESMRISIKESRS